MINRVALSRRAQKQILNLPGHVQNSLQLWVCGVRLRGLYRAIYEIKEDGQVEFLEIVEVNKHDYR